MQVTRKQSSRVIALAVFTAAALALSPSAALAQSCGMKNVGDIVNKAMTETVGGKGGGLTMQTDLRTGDSTVIAPKGAVEMTTVSQFQSSADQALAAGRASEAQSSYTQAARAYEKSGDVDRARESYILSREPADYVETVKSSDEARAEYNRLTALTKAPADVTDYQYYYKQIAYDEARLQLGAVYPEVLGRSEEAQLLASMKLESEIADLNAKLGRAKK